jgi:hypothetical protein
LTNEYGHFIAFLPTVTKRPIWIQFPPPPPSFVGGFEGRLALPPIFHQVSHAGRSAKEQRAEPGDHREAEGGKADPPYFQWFLNRPVLLVFTPSLTTAEALAELIIATELKLGRWQEADLKTRPNGGFSEGGFSGALTGGDADDGGVDRRSYGDGHARLSEPSLVSPQEAGQGVSNIKN